MNNTMFHNYVFFSVDKTINSISSTSLSAYKNAFIREVNSGKNIKTYGYTTLGFKANATFLLWFRGGVPEEIQHLLNRILHTRLGQYLTISYSLFGMTRKSVYTSMPPEKSSSLDTQTRSPYLVIYPFTKTKEWYLLDLSERRKMMSEHIKIGFGYKHIKQLLLYAFGVDDHEFIVSYETDSLPDFQSLVMDLRSSKARLYTLNDQPIFTCIHKPLDGVLEFV